MRCPKCGFTGFDHLDECRKCGRDLTAFKARFTLRPPLVAETPFVPEPQQTGPLERDILPAAVSTAEATDFGYSFMEEPSAGFPAAAKLSSLPGEPKDEFSFEEAGAERLPLEATAVAGHGAADRDEAPLFDSGEFMDLELDLSWDEKPTAAAEMPTPETSSDLAGTDDFDFPSLDDLPPLEGNPPPEEEAFGEEILDDLGDLPAFDELDLEDPEEQPGKKGDTRDPFDYRGHVPTEHAPGDPTRPCDDPQELLCHREGTDEDSPLLSRGAPPSFPETQLAAVHSEKPPLRDEPLPEGDLSDAFCEEVESLATPAPARLAATLADGAILLGGFFLFVCAGEIALNPASGRFFPSSASLHDLLIPYFFVLFFLGFSYFTLFHFLLGQTLGKMLLRLRVESADGDSVLFSQALLRSAGGFFSLVAAGAGFVPILSGGRGWNDRLAGTRVVRASRIEILFEEIA